MTTAEPYSKPEANDALSVFVRRARARPAANRARWLNIGVIIAAAGLVLQAYVATAWPRLDESISKPKLRVENAAPAEQTVLGPLATLPQPLAESIEAAGRELQILRDRQRLRAAEFEAIEIRAALTALSQVLPKPGALRASRDSGETPGPRQDSFRGTARHKIRFQPHTPERCLPKDLLAVIYDVADTFGAVKMVSTHRSLPHNLRVGGAPRSFHLECRAIDFVVAGRTSGLESYLRSRAEIGGLKRYPLGFFHIDNGPVRTW